MIKSYLLTALRHFRKNKLHASINILGLGLGLMVSMMALIFMLDEQSFDTFHTKAERLYRLNKVRTDNQGNTSLNAESSGLYGPGMKDEFPEVEKFVRYQPWYNTVVLSFEGRNITLKEEEAVFVDNDFFNVFDFELVRGNREEALVRPSTIVLTNRIASLLFGSQDPIGKSIVGINGLEFEVTGVAEEAPRNSHIQYKALISFASTTPQLGPLDYEWMNNWHTQTLTTYLLLYPEADPAPIRSKLKDFTAQHIPTRVDSYEFYLQPFKDIYLSSNVVLYHRMAKTGNQKYVYFFGLIAGFILFIACVNYINISTSKSTKRAREVGMRKTLGASKQQLINQFLGESFLTTILSGLLALLLLYMAVPLFNEIAGKTIGYDLLWTREVIGAIAILMILVSVIAGGYPAFVLSAFRTSEVLKPSAKSSLKGNWPRHVLITFQLIIAVIMIACTLIVRNQLQYVFSKDLGFDKDHIVVMELTSAMIPQGEVIQQEISRHSSIVSTSLSRMALGGGSSSTYVQPEGFPPDQVEIRMFPVDFQFKETYGLTNVMGRFFDNKIASDSNALIINEALMKQLQWDDPTQKTIKFQDDPVAYPVIGVVKDFNFRSLYQEVEPLVMWLSSNNRRNLSIRFSGNPSELLTFMETTWKKFESRYPFQYYFVDQAFAEAYESDQKVFKTVVTFSTMSIIIACLGLYGLVSFTIEQRTKEFGIRKILGATVSGLSYMVNRKFIAMVLLAGAIAIPVVLKMIKPWLATFAYQIDLGVGVFALSIGITLLVTLLAVSIQAIKAATTNPSEALRYE
ncbi:MAG: ABC transporter permease [Cyclobacteriaceae bacterium]